MALQLELPLELAVERQPGSKKGASRWLADRALDKIRNRFGWESGLAMPRLCWERPVPFPTHFANLPKRNCDHLTEWQISKRVLGLCNGSGLSFHFSARKLDHFFQPLGFPHTSRSPS